MTKIATMLPLSSSITTMFVGIITILCINGIFLSRSTISTTTVVQATPSTTTMPASVSASASASYSSSSSSSSPSPSPLSPSPLSPYKIVIDAGSTGSRLHVFEFRSNDNDNDHDKAINNTDNKTFVERRGSNKVNIPLSNFAKTDSNNDSNYDYKVMDNSTYENKHQYETHAALHLLPLFKYASNVIPSQYHASTTISILATAGMRLVASEHQTNLYDYIHETLMGHEEFVFDNFERDDISTLDGVLEGLYGAIAVNYLKGVVDVHLHYNDDRNDINNNDKDIHHNDGRKMIENKLKRKRNIYEHGVHSEKQNEFHEVKNEMDDRNLFCDQKTPFGALDMGGASMQIVYLPPSSSPSPLSSATSTLSQQQGQTCFIDGEVTSSNGGNDNENATKKLPSHEFFSTSYLSYGSDQFRERLWDTWIADYEKAPNDDDKEEKEEGDEKIILNPCSFQEYQNEWKGYLLLGTGDARECTRQVNRLIPHHEEVYDFNATNSNSEKNQNNGDYSYSSEQSNIVGGIEHPPISGKFYAMSLFFFVMDCVRIYTNDETLLRTWPNPSLHELTNAVEVFCSKHWLHDIMHTHGDTLHKYTRGDILAERCFESVYIIALLRDGFGFSSHSRDITYSFLVDGSEVEWSLGMAISLYAEENQEERELMLPITDTTYLLKNVLIMNDEGIEQGHGDHYDSDSNAMESPSCDDNITECVPNSDDNSKVVKDKDFTLSHFLENGPLWS